MFKMSNLVWPNNEVGPGMLSWFHIMWIIICIGLCVLFARLGRRHNEKQNDKVIFTIDVILIVSELLKQYLYDVEFYGYLRLDILPFSFCSIPLFVALIGSLTKNQKIKEGCYKYLSFIGIIGGIGVMIYPVTLETYFIYISIQTMLWHTALIVMAVYLISSRNYGKSFKKDILPSFLVFLILVIFAVVLNESLYYGYLKDATKVNYNIDSNPGAYELYKYGYYDEDKDEYFLLAYENDKFILTNESSKAIDLAIIYPDEYDEDYTPYLFVTFNENGDYKYLSTDGKDIFFTDSPLNHWEYAEIEGNFVMGTLIDDVLYFIDGNLVVNSIFIKEIYNYIGGAETYLQFVDYESLRDGDSVNAFFISRHYDSPIPVLKTIKQNAPYYVYLISYTLSVLIVSSIIWLIAHFFYKKHLI